MIVDKDDMSSKQHATKDVDAIISDEVCSSVGRLIINQQNSHCSNIEMHSMMFHDFSRSQFVNGELSIKISEKNIFDYCVFENINYKYVNRKSDSFRSVQMTNVSLERNIHKDCVYDKSTFTNVIFNGSRFQNVSFKNCIFKNCSFVDGIIECVDFTDCMIWNSMDFDKTIVMKSKFDNISFGDNLLSINKTITNKIFLGYTCRIGTADNALFIKKPISKKEDKDDLILFESEEETYKYKRSPPIAITRSHTYPDIKKSMKHMSLSLSSSGSLPRAYGLCTDHVLEDII